jgi:hypothetical protein
MISELEVQHFCYENIRVQVIAAEELKFGDASAALR